MSTLLARGENLAKSMSSYLIRAIEATPNITVRLRTEVIGGGGGDVLEYLQLAEHTNGSVQEVAADALFIMIGGEPHTQWLPSEIGRDGGGYVLTGRDVLHQPAVHWAASREPFPLETSMPGVFVAGDARHGSITRVASAVGDGATAVRAGARIPARIPSHSRSPVMAINQHLNNYGAQARRADLLRQAERQRLAVRQAGARADRERRLAASSTPPHKPAPRPPEPTS